MQSDDLFCWRRVGTQSVKQVAAETAELVGQLKSELEEFRAENARKWTAVALDIDLTGGRALKAT